MHDQPPSSPPPESAGRLSYKYQRLRERIRRAIMTGELTGKLPGERQLAEQFNVNAKTLSKALTDLAAEGLLERTIGRGTFVRGTQQPTALRERWMIIDNPQTPSILARQLANSGVETQVISDVSTLRPSFLNQFTAVIDLTDNTPESFLRDLVVRNLQVVVAGREPAGLSINCVAIDTMLGASCAGRDLMTAGHRMLAAIDKNGSQHVLYALNKTAERFGGNVSVIRINVSVIRIADDELELALERGVTGIVCDGVTCGRRVMHNLAKMGISVPGQVSVMAIGCVDEVPPCSGYFIHAGEMAESVISLLRSGARRPTTLWLAGRRTDVGTTATAALPVGDGQVVGLSKMAM